MKVIKRDGRTVDFDKNKISSAVIKAIESVQNKEGVDTNVAYQIAYLIY